MQESVAGQRCSRTKARVSENVGRAFEYQAACCHFQPPHLPAIPGDAEDLPGRFGIDEAAKLRVSAGERL
jgi:hypothetical protein